MTKLWAEAACPLPEPSRWFSVRRGAMVGWRPCPTWPTGFPGRRMGWSSPARPSARACTFPRARPTHLLSTVSLRGFFVKEGLIWYPPNTNTPSRSEGSLNTTLNERKKGRNSDPKSYFWIFLLQQILLKRYGWRLLLTMCRSIREPPPVSSASPPEGTLQWRWHGIR